MHAIDEILELNSELLLKQAFTFNTENYDEKVNAYLASLPTYLQRLTDIRERMGELGSPNLVTDRMSIADLVMWSSFWKLIYNPEANQETAEKIKAVLSDYEVIEDWVIHMN